MHKKQVYARISNSSGQPLADWHNIDFKGYSKALNAGPSECIINYHVPFDYDSADLQVGNDVKIILTDTDTAAGTVAGESGSLVIYQGYISLIERDVDGSHESVTVHVLGYYTLLALDFLKNGSQTNLYSNSSTGLTTSSGSQSAADIGLMMRAVIDRYIAETANPHISYLGSYDIPNTSTTALYRFEQKTYRQAMDDLRSLSPQDVYWYVNELGRVTFRTKPTTTTHTFQFGKHFTSVHVEHSLEKVRNFLLLWDGKTSSYVYKHYQDDASVAAYGRRAGALNDYGIDASSAADAIGAKFLAESKAPAIKVTCAIIDNNGENGRGYDIESIQPGDTCSFIGFSSGLSDIFNENMLITSVDYKLDAATITVEIVQAGMLALQGQQQRALSDIGSGGLGIPPSYS